MQEIFVVRVFQGSGATVLLFAAMLIAVIALVDWHFEDNVSFGFLYLFPMLMVGGCLRRWQIAGVAALCTGLTEAFDAFPWAMPVSISRIILTFAAFFGAGYFGFGAARSRRLANQHLGDIHDRSLSLVGLTHYSSALFATDPLFFTLPFPAAQLLR
jgi:two-component system, LuxR family, sensor kinase FixL